MKSLNFILSTTEKTENTNTSQIEVSSPTVLQRLLTPYDLNIDMDSAKLYLEESAVFLVSDRETGEDISISQYKLIVRDSSGQTFSPRESSPLGQLNRLFDPEDEQYLRDSKERDKLVQLLHAKEIQFVDGRDIKAITLLMKYYGDFQLDRLIALYKAYKITKDEQVQYQGITENQFNLAKRLMLDGIRRASPQKTEVSDSIIYRKKNCPTQFPLTLELLQLEHNGKYYYELVSQETGGTLAQIGENFLPKAVLYYITHMEELHESDKEK